MAQFWSQELPEDLIQACVDGDVPRAGFGWASYRTPVLPLYGIDERGRCQCGDRSCRHAGKHPIPEHAKSGVRSATTDRARLHYILSIDDSVNLGIRMGTPRGARPLVALDVDPRSGGVAAFERLQEDIGEIPRTLTISTGSGGQHLLFALPPSTHIPSQLLGPGLELKATGSYLVAAPSRHASGKRYEILDDHPPILLLDPLLTLVQQGANGVRGKLRDKGTGGVVGGRPYAQGQPITSWHEAELPRVINAMLSGPHAAEALGLLHGDLAANTGPDATPSGADFRLGRLAKRYTRDPVVIELILRQSGLARPKYQRPDYLQRTIRAVLADDPDWLVELKERTQHPVGRRGVPVRERVKQAILTYVAEHADDFGERVYLKVNEVARGQSVSSDTVTRAIRDLADAGQIETGYERHWTVWGTFSCARWVRLLPPPPDP
jgi:hypothetical protein